MLNQTTMFQDANPSEIHSMLQVATQAFEWYKKQEPARRASFLETIAVEIENLGSTLIQTAQKETNLPEGRLLGERARTIFQLRSFAAMLREGSWVEAAIDTAIPDRVPPKPDLRKMLFPLGPVVVFGASNFPFAYSTAGGDTASALAVGCPVIVKAHPAHPQTSEMVAQAISKAMDSCGIPAGVFQHLHGSSFEVGQLLVQHPLTKAVGFTGSLAGGKALYDHVQQRKKPIPLFAEMSSTNPIVLLPEVLRQNSAAVASMIADSITLGMGQFCTNPGLMIAIEGEDLDNFLQLLGQAIAQAAPSKMLHAGIEANYLNRLQQTLSTKGVSLIAAAATTNEPVPAVATVRSAVFLQNPLLHEEVFGPFSLLVSCPDQLAAKEVLQAVEGQLTTSIHGTLSDFQQHQALIEVAQAIAGRVVFNGVPTGVEVCPSMVHGGPFPATTDSRFTAVGIHAAKRWVRPISFQNCPQELLPDELKDENTRHIWRLVNNEFTKASL